MMEIPQGFSWGDGNKQLAHALVPNPSATSFGPARRRLQALCLVLFVSFGRGIFASVYSLTGALATGDQRQTQARLLSVLISDTASLAVFWYVLSGQGRRWKDIGWNFEWTDILRAVALLIGSQFASYLVSILVQTSYYSHFGHYLAPKSLHGLLGFGISGLSIAVVFMNPFFEELIVRGYLMSEIVDLGGNGALAIFLSIAVQMSYHLYQGLAHGIGLTVTFAVYSIYFWKTRRLVPVVLAHFCLDAYALVWGNL
jgi:membrane protease YdiL (CAAX protease family)